MNTITFKTCADEKALFRFQLYSVYHNIQGYAIIFTSVLCWVYLILTWNNSKTGLKILLVFLGLFYLLFKPLSLFMKSKLQAKQEAFKVPLEFTCSDEKITVSQGEQSVEVEWNMIMKIVVRKKDIYVYTGRLYAYMIQKEQAGEAWKAFVTMAEQKGCVIK